LAADAAARAAWAADAAAWAAWAWAAGAAVIDLAALGAWAITDIVDVPLLVQPGKGQP